MPYSIENRSSTRRQDSFVEGAISELMSRGCLREVSDYPQFWNPLHVAVQSSRKLRLMLDLTHLNKFVVKKSVEYEDLRTVLQLFSPGMFVFSFDLKSAYHHVDICEEHRKFLSFKQDGRWRRGRHIHVKAEARPTSRFTRLSMLSNTATAN